MTRDETVALFLQGRDSWNTWAKQLLAEQKGMVANGRWSVEPENEATRNWVSRARADFSFFHFLSTGAINEHREAEAKATLVRRAAEVGLDVKSVLIEAGTASFDDFIFPSKVAFISTMFSICTSFKSAHFHSITSFASAAFSGDASFDRAYFYGFTSFENATFSGSSWFNDATFLDYVLFRTAFVGPTSFDSVAFRGSVTFDDRTFTHYVSFRHALFGSRANFSLTTFKGSADFDKARFQGEADFKGIVGERVFSMVGARFEDVPDFIQAHFAEAPRLDNTRVTGWWKNSPRLPPGVPKWSRFVIPPLVLLLKMVEGLRKEDAPTRDLPARWRALKRLAIQAHDTDRELEFHARGMQSQRFAEDWPLPLKFWEGDAWASSYRFSFGIGYELFSNFGRSVFWPFFFWLVGTLAFGAFYLSQTEVMQRDVKLQDASHLSGTIQAGRYAWSDTVPCYPPPLTPSEDWRKRWRWRGVPLPDPNQTRVDGLSEKLRSQTNARAEALHLAFRNAFVVLDGGSDASHRMYGCLYGLELYAGQNPVPIVPSAVSTASAIQKLISGVLIFLFGLALRNMLKVK